MKILIVEDEINAREGLAELLSKMNPEYSVCGKASDGEQGFLLFKELKPDLIFVDIEMPKLNGLQMIEKIKEIGEEPCFVILSGYSEFKYAQKSISLGVAEYLLKPVTYSNLKNIMMEINKKVNLKKEKNRAYGRNISEEEILEKLILNHSRDAEAVYSFFESHVNQEVNMTIVNLYLREKDKSSSKLIIKKINNFMEYYDIKTFYYSIIDEYNYITIFMNTKIDFSEIIKMIKYNLLFSIRKDGFSDITVSTIKLKNLDEIKSKSLLDKLKKLSKWAITLGNDEVINEELISKLKINNCTYPREFENEVILAIKDNDFIKLSKINEKLIEYLKSGVYDPLRIIEICGNYAFSILTILKGCNNNFYAEFKDDGVINDLRRSCTLDELKGYLNVLSERICKRCDKDLQISSFPVRKAVNYINEYYNDKISLEEIASNMNITPEYLSRLFTKEMGKSFSDYLKEFRIDKAKKLIVNDKVKIYEVAEKVGYSDPKYFCKMFKDVTGMTPKEYMKFY